MSCCSKIILGNKLRLNCDWYPKEAIGSAVLLKCSRVICTFFWKRKTFGWWPLISVRMGFQLASNLSHIKGISSLSTIGLAQVTLRFKALPSLLIHILKSSVTALDGRTIATVNIWHVLIALSNSKVRTKERRILKVKPIHPTQFLHFTS